jgi:hypothetical protein
MKKRCGSLPASARRLSALTDPLHEHLGGTAETAQFGNSDEGLKQSKVHRDIIHFSYLMDTKHSIYAAMRSP